MAQAAVESAASGGAFIGRTAEAPRMKRKTPSELRGEQLKRRVSEKVADDQPFPSAAFDRKSTNGLRHPEQQNISKHTTIRVTEVFQVRKSRNLGKENCKYIIDEEKVPKSADAVTTSQSATSLFPRGHGDSDQLDSSAPSLAEAAKQGFRKAEKRSKKALRSVSELHIGDEKQSGSSKLDKH